MKISKRRYTQLISAVLYNCNITGFMKGSIYKGELKGICAPGINCYSCPGAVTSCPLGSLQAGLLSSKYKLPYFILGTIILMGLFLGRFICGFLCPFGLLQELIYKLPLPKLRKNRATRILSYLKYVILIFFVIAIPLIKLAPGFCKYICPDKLCVHETDRTLPKQKRNLIGSVLICCILRHYFSVCIQD